VTCPFQVHPEWSLYLSAVPTRLGPFDAELRSRLVNWGYLVSDVALRSWVAPDPAPSLNLPFPEFGLSGPPSQGGRAAAGHR
jgi:hypothetical protein